MSELIIEAALNADWQQVVLNEGPPCFHYEPERGLFCLRAESWAGHEDMHKFTSLQVLIAAQLAEARAAQRESDAKMIADDHFDYPRLVAKIRANISPADAQFIERVRAEAALECKEALVEAANALDSLWAAIGDALCSGKGIEKEYANAVSRDVAHAKERISQLSQQAGRTGS